MAEIFRPVCSAVDAAHRHQLIHRDLKPENIFLVRNADTETETVKVLDFGVAKFDASEAVPESQNYAVTESGVLVGTLGYMSPEQLLGEKAAISRDVWALAVTAYETLTDALPFPVADRVAWRQSVLAGSYTPLSQYRSSLSRSHFAEVCRFPKLTNDRFWARCGRSEGAIVALS